MAARRAVAPLVAAALALGVLVGIGPADATPARPKPSASAVAESRRAAAHAASVLASARLAQAGAQKQLDALDAQLEILVERWNAARADAEGARGVAAAAQEQARVAQSDADRAQGDVDRLAAQSYQLGSDLSGGLGEWAAVLDSAMSPGGITELTDRVASLGQVAADRRARAVSTADLRLRALQAQMAAERASADVALRERQAADAATAVQATQALQRSEVARLTWDPLESTCRHASLSIL